MDVPSTATISAKVPNGPALQSETFTYWMDLAAIALFACKFHWVPGVVDANVRSCPEAPVKVTEPPEAMVCVVPAVN